MPPLPYIPDDVWTHVVSYLAPPPPVSMTAHYPSLLSDVLERYRTPDRSRTDLVSFWKVSKRFKVLADRKYYSYINIDNDVACKAFALQLDEWVASGTVAADRLSQVVGLTFRPGVLDRLADAMSADQVDPIVVIFSHLRRLEYLDLGGAVPSYAVMYAVSAHPPIRSLVGLQFSPRHFDAIVSALASLSTTLRHLGIVGRDGLEVTDTRASLPSVRLPNVYSVDFGNPNGHGARNLEHAASAIVLAALSLPALKVHTINMVAGPVAIGEVRGDQLNHVESLREFTPPLKWMLTGNSRASQKIDRLQVLAFQLSVGRHWSDTWQPSLHPFPAVRTLILVQPDDRSAAHSQDGIGKVLSNFVCRRVFPALEHVYYITENEKGDVWRAWARCAVTLADSGVRVNYL